MALAVAAAAPGATVKIANGALRYGAATGERNDVGIVMSNDRRTWTVTDSGAPLAAGSGCTRKGAHRAACRVPRPFGDDAVRARLGDRADRVSVAQACSFLDDDEHFGECRTYVSAGRGDDTVHANEDCDATSSARGGPGDDRLSGTGSMWGGSGADTLTADCYGRLDGGPGSDTLDGTNGYVTAVYTGRSQPVSVTLDGRRNDGEAGERDLVVRVENVEGGRAGDTIVGDSKANVLLGGPGADVLRGAGGSDQLDGEAVGCTFRARKPGGRDRLVGGPGNDAMSGCGGNDVLRGGPGSDGLVGSGGADLIEAGSGGDEVTAGYGPDRIVGGTGKDEIFGLPGDDVIRARDGVADRLDGGTGTDRARIDAGLDQTTAIERVS